MKSELLAPAGEFETALAAFEAGADAVYCGLAEYSARAYANNFSPDELRLLMRVAKAKEKKVYVAFNTLVEEAELEKAVRQLELLNDIGPDGIIVQDLGIARIAKRHFPRLKLHASTQLVAHNLEGVLALKELGFERVVLARELSLEEIISITKRCGVEIECFIHGALCYSISGLCLYSAMEKGRSGNKGRCAYCCRLAHDDGKGSMTYPFSMKDLRLGESVSALVEAGVASLKIEGRMKSSLYVASVTQYYRQILDGKTGVSVADLETVFSRRTTKLYFDGKMQNSPIDPTSLGHLGTEIGTVKRVTKDRYGRAYLRFHTMRALEKHDGLQFAAKDPGKPRGFGIGEMRNAISRQPVFEVSAGTDIEVLIPENFDVEPGEKVYCSMSNSVKRKFAPPAFRPSEYPGTSSIDVTVSIEEGKVSANDVVIEGRFEKAKQPENTFGAVVKAFEKLGGTDYVLGELTLVDSKGLFVPVSILNELRRRLVAKLDAERVLQRAVEFEEDLDMQWNETADAADRRYSLPVFTRESEYSKLRVMVKKLIRDGHMKWEVADLAGLRLLRSLGVEDITGDWSCYAMNSAAIAAWKDLGIKCLVASPENSRENLQYLAECGFPFEFLSQQSTPLFISLTKPAPFVDEKLAVYQKDGLWVTVKCTPTKFDVPDGARKRIDLSWDPPQ